MKSLSSKIKLAAIIILCVAIVAVAGFDGVMDFLKTILIIILLFPLLVGLFYIKVLFDEKRFKKRYEAYLKKMNGSCLLFYNNRKNSIAFIEKVLAPALNFNIKMIPVTRSQIKVGPESEFFAKMLESVETRNGFPYLAKILDEKVFMKSVNNQFYNVMNGNKPLEPLLDRINTFYSSTPTVSIA
ncbi:hypothetical protein Q3A66_06250 [Hymenobacter sp. BT770]|uniref:hypothetical protein n=1 Tax=Hymenobacter sp. BT770 TaxID=2886942 RepID=UPI001D122FA0|nr:hypothetical protein [Hymenobacter sp. BT770]MCC3152590.1 hypothetical protein [Hymenobacter sp. BT770]MDO3414663.1 hypothetical protein [Hymenobacter sp. BT770]